MRDDVELIVGPKNPLKIPVVRINIDFSKHFNNVSGEDVPVPSNPEKNVGDIQLKFYARVQNVVEKRACTDEAGLIEHNSQFGGDTVFPENSMMW